MGAGRSVPVCWHNFLNAGSPERSRTLAVSDTRSAANGPRVHAPRSRLSASVSVGQASGGYLFFDPAVSPFASPPFVCSLSRREDGRSRDGMLGTRLSEGDGAIFVQRHVDGVAQANAGQVQGFARPQGRDLVPHP